MARNTAALPLGATPRRRPRRDGGVATVRPGEVSRLVGLRDDARPGCRGDSLSPRAGYHARHERRMEDGRGSRRSGGGDRAHLGRPTLASHRQSRGGPRDRSCVHSWDCVAHPGRDQARGGGRRMIARAPRRVVITGVGAVTPIGTAAAGLWAGLEARASAVREITRFDPAPFRSRIAAEIPDFRPQDHLDAKRARRLDRFSQLAVTSALLALTDAELEAAREDPDRVGVMMGSALGGVAYAEAQVPKYLAEGPRGLDAGLALAVFAGAASCNIAIEGGFTGPNATNAMSCASGTIAVGEAFHVVRDGRADVMFAGGAEAPLAPP